MSEEIEAHKPTEQEPGKESPAPLCSARFSRHSRHYVLSALMRMNHLIEDIPDSQGDEWDQVCRDEFRRQMEATRRDLLSAINASHGMSHTIPTLKF